MTNLIVEVEFVLFALVRAGLAKHLLQIERHHHRGVQNRASQDFIGPPLADIRRDHPPRASIREDRFVPIGDRLCLGTAGANLFRDRLDVGLDGLRLPGLDLELLEAGELPIYQNEARLRGIPGRNRARGLARAFVRCGHFLERHAVVAGSSPRLPRLRDRPVGAHDQLSGLAVVAVHFDERPHACDRLRVALLFVGHLGDSVESVSLRLGVPNGVVDPAVVLRRLRVPLELFEQDRRVHEPIGPLALDLRVGRFCEARRVGKDAIVLDCAIEVEVAACGVCELEVRVRQDRVEALLLFGVFSAPRPHFVDDSLVELACRFEAIGRFERKGRILERERGLPVTGVAVDRR